MGNKASTEKQDKKILEKLKEAPEVVIIGGGYAGINVAKALDSEVNVVLIDKKEFFWHNIAGLRAAVQPGFEDKCIIPYTKCLKYGRFIQGSITHIDTEQKKLDCSLDYGVENITYDYLVVCTGSCNAFPDKLAEKKSAASKENCKEIAEEIARAQDILVIGGGPTGIELVGEIKFKYPQKKVTILTKGSQLMEKYEYGDKFQKRLEDLMNDAGPNGVNCIFGEEVIFDDELTPDTHFLSGRREIKTRFKTEIRTHKPDLVFLTLGARNQTQCFESSLPLNDQNRLDIDEFYQVRGFEGQIWGIGDCAGSGPQMGFHAIEGGPVLAKNLLKSLKGETSFSTWKPPLDPCMIVTFGEDKGVAKMGGLGVWGNWFSKTMKSKEMDCKNMWKMCGFEGIENVDNPEEDIDNPPIE